MTDNVVILNGISIDLDYWDWYRPFSSYFLYTRDGVLIAKIISSEECSTLILYKSYVNDKYLDLPYLYSKMFNKLRDGNAINLKFNNVKCAKEHFNKFIRKVEKLKAFL